METFIQKTRSLRGILRVPGDKSISHRALIMGAAAKGKQIVEGLPESADIASTIAALRALGCLIEEMPDSNICILSRPPKPGVIIDAGNSATTARLLSGLVAGLGMECAIDGDESLRRRPMARVTDPLSSMGAKIRTAPGGKLPITMKGGRLKGITYPLAVPSAQVKSAILLAGLYAEGETTVRESVPCRDHTEKLFAFMGVPVEKNRGDITVKGGSIPRGGWIKIPGDISSAAYFIVAASCVPYSDIILPCVGINPTRVGIIEVLKQMGADVEILPGDDYCEEPVADIFVKTSRLCGTEVPRKIVPLLIDELPIIAVAATQADGETTVTGAKELRYKECDRIRTTVKNLKILGADIEELEDGFIARGPASLHGGRVSSHGDHRIAMAMAVAGLLAEGTTYIDESGSVAVSYPRFFRDLGMLASNAAGKYR